MHVPVLLKDVISYLNLRAGSVVFDATLGAGGYAKEIIKKIAPNGIYVGVDWDKEAIARFKEYTQTQQYIPKRNLFSINDNYAQIGELRTKLGVPYFDAVVADIGMSSDQIEKSGRGFSFIRNEPLDMRFHIDEKIPTAAQILSAKTEKELADIFYKFGEEKFSRRIAKNIVERRKVKPILTSLDLASIVVGSYPERLRGRKPHPATKVFQALRIYVNSELKNLETFLPEALKNLASGGRLAVLSYHSLEDRIVKNFFRDKSKQRELKLIIKKPVTPSYEEVMLNPRSRSAKLRVAEKI